MVTESTCYKNPAILVLWIGIIPKPPRTTIDRIHKVGLSGDYTDWKPSTNNFSIGNQIRRNPEPGLCSPWMNTEARNHLIKYQSCARCLCDRTNFRQKFLRLQIRSTALYWFYQNGRQFMCMSANVFK
ncbi:hypothetical protein D3C74_163780 [compost metagenome]